MRAAAQPCASPADSTAAARAGGGERERTTTAAAAELQIHRELSLFRLGKAWRADGKPSARRC